MIDASHSLTLHGLTANAKNRRIEDPKTGGSRCGLVGRRPVAGVMSVTTIRTHKHHLIIRCLCLRIAVALNRAQRGPTSPRLSRVDLRRLLISLLLCDLL
jgi:hypothetical protein